MVWQEPHEVQKRLINPVSGMEKPNYSTVYEQAGQEGPAAPDAQ